MADINLGRVLGWTADDRFFAYNDKILKKRVGYFGGGGVSPTLGVNSYFKTDLSFTTNPDLAADFKGSGGYAETRDSIPITVDGDFTVANWQTNLVQNDNLGRTYVQRFGNTIKGVSGMRDMSLGGKFELYSPSSVEATYVNGSITTVTFFTLYIGTLSIL